jgi:hypothetical protein
MKYKVTETITGKVHTWTLKDILEELNRDRSENFQAYNKSDWREGWKDWIEGYTYTLNI